MVVMVIIGVLAALIVPNVLDRADDARVTAAKTDIANIVQQLKMYRLDNQRYPRQSKACRHSSPNLRPAPFPTTGNLIWTSCRTTPGAALPIPEPRHQGEIDVMSFGADGQSGGEGKDADIGSWQ